MGEWMDGWIEETERGRERKKGTGQRANLSTQIYVQCDNVFIKVVVKKFGFLL